MQTRLIRLITMQKVLKTCSNKSVKKYCLGSNQEHREVEISSLWNVTTLDLNVMTLNASLSGTSRR